MVVSRRLPSLLICLLYPASEHRADMFRTPPPVVENLADYGTLDKAAAPPKASRSHVKLLAGLAAAAALAIIAIAAIATQVSFRISLFYSSPCTTAFPKRAAAYPDRHAGDSSKFGAHGTNVNILTDFDVCPGQDDGMTTLAQFNNQEMMVSCESWNSTTSTISHLDHAAVLVLSMRAQAQQYLGSMPRISREAYSAIII
jgi:hypothetical protein